MTGKERREELRDAHRSAERPRRIDVCPLTEARLRPLVDHVDADVLDLGCDHSTRLDREIVMNVHPDDVFGR